MIASAAAFLPDAPELVRARALIRQITEMGVSKYNTGAHGEIAAPPGHHVVLVAGQVEDDASVLRGAGEVRGNLGLLEAARAANPGAWLVYKPHPDVEAGLRAGSLGADDCARLADHIACDASPGAALAVADEVWTMTSLIGFEALVRGRKVVCLGAPFYAGWGLTEDLGPVPAARRVARPGLDGLVWAALIAYPSYHDPVTGLPCPAEVAVDRLAARRGFPRGPGRRLLSKMQEVMAGAGHIFWR